MAIVEYVDYGLIRTSTLLFKILDKVLMVMKVSEIGLITATLTPIIQVDTIDGLFYLLLFSCSQKCLW